MDMETPRTTLTCDRCHAAITSTDGYAIPHGTTFTLCLDCADLTEGGTMDTTYQSRAAQEAQASNYGGPSYWAYLEEAAIYQRDYFLRHGDYAQADLMMTRTLSEALMGNDGI